MPLYLLKRRISEVSGPDRLLGVFRSRDAARRARRQYLDPILRGDVADPWAWQAYRKNSLERDVAIVADVPQAGVAAKAARVFVVSSYAEGFAQIIREFEAICATKAQADATARRIEKRHRGGFNFYCRVDGLAVGALLPDRRDA
ncbi:MAG TPA: hypothetical protein VFL90_04745 [Methylomirabilota bacterium]|nr:hypothetical protein [Methylomirabilota bacterium]